MGPIVELVPKKASEDTIAALETLLAEARAGNLIGLAYAGLCPARKYIIDVAGEARAAPVFTHGLVALLAHELIRIHRHRR